MNTEPQERYSLTYEGPPGKLPQEQIVALLEDLQVSGAAGAIVRLDIEPLVKGDE